MAIGPAALVGFQAGVIDVLPGSSSLGLEIGEHR